MKWKNLKSRLVIFRPLFLISLGLHGVLLWLPVSVETETVEETEKPEAEEDAIKITRLPPPASATPSPREISPQPTPQFSPTPSSVPRSPQPQRSAVRSLPERRSTPTPQKARLQQPKLSPSFSSPIESSPTPSPSPSPSPSPITSSPTPTPVSTSTPSPSTSPQGGSPIAPTSSPSTSPQEDPFAQFPIYPNATEGSGETNLLPDDLDTAAFNTTEELARVASFYESEVPTKGFNSLETVDNTNNFKVYKVSPGNGIAPRYLHLVSMGDTTVIILIDRQVSSNKLTELKKEIELLTPEEIALERIFNNVYREFNLRDFNQEDIESLNSVFLRNIDNESGDNERMKANFRGRIPIEDPSNSISLQQLENEIIARVKQKEFETGEFPNPNPENGIKAYLLSRGSLRVQLTFVPVKINGQITTGIITNNSLMP